MPGRVTGLAEILFSVNKSPYGGICGVEPSHGIADKTVFTFSCADWLDKDLPLDYAYFYHNSFNLSMLIYRGPKQTIQTKLPVGNPSSNYTLHIVIQIADYYGAFTSTSINVQVNGRIKLPS